MDKDIEVKIKELEARIEKLEKLINQKADKGHYHMPDVRSRMLD